MSSWLKLLTTPIPELFKKTEKAQQAELSPGAPATKTAEKAPPGAPEPPKEVADAVPKGLMGLFYRKWKDPAFLKQLKILAAHMTKDGIDLRNQGQVKEWLEKNKADIETGKFNEAPDVDGKPQTYVKTGPDVGRNDPCPCGSGKKYKKCCATKA